MSVADSDIEKPAPCLGLRGIPLPMYENGLSRN